MSDGRRLSPSPAARGSSRSSPRWSPPLFLLALATRHAPSPEVIAIVARLLQSPTEATRVSAVGAAALLGGPELTAAVKAAASRSDMSQQAKPVFEAGVRDLERHTFAWQRREPFKDPEEVFLARW